VSNASAKSMVGLGKPERSEGFGARGGPQPTSAMSEDSRGWLSSYASHRERSKLGEISTPGACHIGNGFCARGGHIKGSSGICDVMTGS
jgi:hypothetical protein